MLRAARTADRVLITGGAGFIGSHLADELLRHGYRVRVLDHLSEQVHGPGGDRPDYLSDDVELIEGDARNPEAVKRALNGCDAVFHLAAMVGVGQSMYEVSRYTDVNNVGTATLLEALIERPVQRLIVASSMSIYGEGLYAAADPSWSAARPMHSNGNGHGNGHGSRNGNGRHAQQSRNGDAASSQTGRNGKKVYDHIARTPAQMKAHQWDPTGPNGEPLVPLPTPETKHPDLASVYALSKYDQERMCLIVGRAYQIPTAAMRFFNVYGPRQALSNPYTGVLAIFASRLLNDRPPLIFEDGLQQRDFVSVYDVARACRLALEVPDATADTETDPVYNVGSGQRYTIRALADALAHVVNKDHLAPQITGDYRAGDIRHCFADISKAQRVLGYQPQVTLEEGMTELAQWLDGQTADDRVEQARAELVTRGLTV